MMKLKILKVRRADVPAGETPRCERCENIDLRRQGRVGFLERVVFPHFGFFPWECGLCRGVVYLRQRAVRKAEAAAGRAAGFDPLGGGVSGPAQPAGSLRVPHAPTPRRTVHAKPHVPAPSLTPPMPRHPAPAAR